jgi:hypothetical protein
VGKVTKLLQGASKHRSCDGLSCASNLGSDENDQTYLFDFQGFIGVNNLLYFANSSHNFTFVIMNIKKDVT